MEKRSVQYVLVMVAIVVSGHSRLRLSTVDRITFTNSSVYLDVMLGIVEHTTKTKMSATKYARINNLPSI